MACHTRGILITIITLISTPKTSFCPPPIALVPTAVPAYPLLRHALPLPSHHWRRLPLPFQPGDRPHSDLTQPHRDPNQHEAHSRPLLLSLTVKVCNRDFFSLTYDILIVSDNCRRRQPAVASGRVAPLMSTPRSPNPFLPNNHLHLRVVIPRSPQCLQQCIHTSLKLRSVNLTANSRIPNPQPSKAQENIAFPLCD